MCGYVPVAPAAAEAIKDPDSISVPTLVVYGERDTSMGAGSAKILTKLPYSTKAWVSLFFREYDGCIFLTEIVSISRLFPTLVIPATWMIPRCSTPSSTTSCKTCTVDL